MLLVVLRCHGDGTLQARVALGVLSFDYSEKHELLLFIIANAYFVIWSNVYLNQVVVAVVFIVIAPVRKRATWYTQYMRT